MSINQEDVRHIATLARVGMTEEDVQRFQRQLSNILENFQVLQSVNTEGVSPTGHSVTLHSVMRPDESGPSLPCEETLTNAPRREQDFFRVRAVLE